jgi:hypothetical protein
MKPRSKAVLGLFVIVLIAAAALAAELAHRPRLPPVPRGPRVSAPVAAPDRPAPNPLRNAYFGETHLHTSYSLDANLFGTRNDPRMAYRFALGEPVAVPGSEQLQRIVAPLDFVAVTDHAEGLGAYDRCTTPGNASYWSLDCLGMRLQVVLVFPRFFKSLAQSGAHHGRYPAGPCGDSGVACVEAARNVWQDTINAANEFYQPGKFTTFVGYEYTPTLADGGMLHRNVIFRSDQVPDHVFSAADGFAEDLLRWLDANCRGACQALSIPHNPNFSWGLMFGDTNSDATPVTRENLALRARYERLVEIFQIKGSSECSRGVGSADEECGFENLFPACTAEQLKIDPATGQHAPHCVGPNDMVREVLKRGLAAQSKWGFNPFKLGFVGGTDNHNGMPGDTNESTYKGHAGEVDGDPKVRLGLASNVVTRALTLEGSRLNPGGLTGVWAEENTREGVWDALKRRESWGTSGTRIRVRLFAGFDFPADLHRQADMIERAYATGVPMGGDLVAAPAGRAPRLLVWARRDLDSAPLQRLQIVKGWLKADGTTDERVYDVACSDGLAPDAHTHRCADNGARVDLKTCAISADKGAPELATTWTDPDFRADERAFYYARVLENPVCRYSQHDALRLGVPLPPGIPATIQERAWSSPIWYGDAAPRPGVPR